MDYELIQQGVDLLKEMTGGQIEITLFPVGALVSSKEMLEALGDGLYEVQFGYPAYYSGIDPGFASIGTLPAIFEHPDDVLIWLDYYGGKQIVSKAFADHNVYFVDAVTIPPEPVMSKDPIRTLADFEGVTIRTPTGTTHEIFARLGASPVQVSGGEVYTALETGLVDAIERLNVKSNYDEGYHEVTKYILYPSFHAPTGVQELAVNMDVWNTLPDNLKAIYHSYAIAANRFFYLGTLAQEFSALKLMQDYGLEWNQLSAADMAQTRVIGIEVAEEWATKSPLASEVINSVFDYLKAVGKM